MAKNKHVVPSGNRWAVKTAGTSKPDSVHLTQGAAERAAKQSLGKAGGGEVRIHRRDGTIRDSDTVAPARDPHPPKDSQH